MSHVIPVIINLQLIQQLQVLNSFMEKLQDWWNQHSRSSCVPELCFRLQQEMHKCPHPRRNTWGRWGSHDTAMRFHAIQHRRECYMTSVVLTSRIPPLLSKPTILDDFSNPKIFRLRRAYETGFRDIYIVFRLCSPPQAENFVILRFYNAILLRKSAFQPQNPQIFASGRSSQTSSKIYTK